MRLTGALGHIEIKGLRVMGVHGVLPCEQERAQAFELDLDVELDLSRCGLSDQIADTVDYGALMHSAAKVVAGQSFRLLEALATAVAKVILEDPRVAGASVTVRKLHPPVPLDVSSVGIRVAMKRSASQT